MPQQRDSKGKFVAGAGGARLTVTRVDHGWAELVQAINGLKGAHAKAGILGAAATKSDGALTTLDVAVIHEFGSPAHGIPERSFVRATFEANKAKYQAILQKAVRAIFEGRAEPQRVLALVGMQMAADQQAAIRAGIAPANAPATIAAKGSSTPLIDTGQLVQSITYEVVTPSGE